MLTVAVGLLVAKVIDSVPVERGRLTALFCGDDHSPRWACEALAGAVGGLEERVEVVVGERLSYPDQRVTRGRPAELAGRDFDPLSLVLLRNAEPWTPPSPSSA